MSATAAGDQDDQRDGECDNHGLHHGLPSTRDNALLVHTMRSLPVSDSPPERRLSLPTFCSPSRSLPRWPHLLTSGFCPQAPAAAGDALVEARERGFVYERLPLVLAIERQRSHSSAPDLCVDDDDGRPAP